jgi:hypothetical protein
MAVVVNLGILGTDIGSHSEKLASRYLAGMLDFET